MQQQKMEPATTGTEPARDGFHPVPDHARDSDAVERVPTCTSSAGTDAIAPGLLPIVVLATLVLLAVLSSSWQKRSLYATPILAPLALLGARGLLYGVRVRVSALLNVAIAFLFSTAAAICWLAWVAQFTGWPPVVLSHIHALLPDFVPSAHLLAFTVALLATGGWVALIVCRKRQSEHLAVHWAGGIALIYLLVMTLWLPVANGNMTYRRDFAGLREALGENPGIIGSRGLGEPQRALIHYYAGIKPLREETRGKLDWHWMLIEGTERE